MRRLKLHQLKVNGELKTVDVDENMPLLWALRDELGITGPKFGCGKSLCGACTVYLNGNPVKSCVLPVGNIQGDIETIENPNRSEVFQVVQKKWIEHQVAQCGYCQPGQILSAASLLSNNQNPSDEQIDTAMQGNICRCGTYPRIKKALKDAASSLQSSKIKKDDVGE